MSLKNSQISVEYDAELQLHDNTTNTGTGAAITTPTGSAGVINLRRLDAAIGNDAGRIGAGTEYLVHVMVTEVDDDYGDATVALQVDDAIGFGSAVTFSETVIEQGGRYALGCTREHLENLKSGAEYLRLFVDPGTADGVRLRAWVTPAR